MIALFDRPERYVRPPLLATEATPAWVVRWRFRLLALVVIGVLLILAVLLFRQLTGASAQDPGLGALGAGLSWRR